MYRLQRAPSHRCAGVMVMFLTEGYGLEMMLAWYERDDNALSNS